MSAIAALVLADGQATPVNHTFTPRGVKNAIAKWQDISGGVVAGYPTITFSLREPTKASKATKVTAKIVVPTLEVTSPSTATGIQPAPTKAYDNLCNIEFVFNERSSQAQRKDLAAYVKNYLASAAFQAALNDNETIW